MIIQCEYCQARFRLDESLLNEEGSKVRCSSCEKVFMAYPPPPEPPAEAEPLPGPDEGPEETVILDSPPDLGDVQAEPEDTATFLSSAEEEDEGTGGADEDLDLSFADDMDASAAGVDEIDEVESLSTEDVTDAEDVSVHMEEAFDRASRIEEEVTREDAEGKTPDEEPPAPEATPPVTGKKTGRTSFVTVALGVLLLVGVVYAAFLFFAPGMLPDSLNLLKSDVEQGAEDLGVRRLSFQGVKGAFVRTDQGKQRFVIRGVIVNRYSGPRSFIRVKASILDAKGRSVASRQAYAGNPFTQGELAGKPMAFFEKHMDRRRGEKDQNVGVAPEGSVPFMVVFQDLPEDIIEFEVEAVRSSAGGRS